MKHAVQVSYVINDGYSDMYPQGTLIKTSFGYAAIESLSVGDRVADLCNNDQEVLVVKRVKKAGAYYYALTTENHRFYVYPNKQVHNMDFAILTSFGAISFGLIEVFNPVAVIFGALIPLSYYIFDVSQSSNVDLNSVFLDENAVLETESYYQIKKNDLSSLYCNLKKLNQELYLFVNNFLKGDLFIASILSVCLQGDSYQNLLKPSFSNILKSCNCLEKQQLLFLMEQDLCDLEKKIFDLAILQGLYIHELIDMKNNVLEQLQDCIDVVNKSVSLFNFNNSLDDPSLEAALYHYEIHFLWQGYLKKAFLILNELKVVDDFYQNNKLNFLFSEFINVIDVLKEQTLVNKNHFDYIKDSQQILDHNIFINEEVLNDFGVLSGDLVDAYRLKSDKIVFENINSILLRVKKKKESMKDIQQHLLTSVDVVGGAPDPNDEEKCFYDNLVKNSSKTAFVKRFGKFYKESDSGLWWSKDRAYHGGQHYKVFKQTTKGFEWVFNADLLGNEIIGQHKGPIGKFISLDLIRFFS